MVETFNFLVTSGPALYTMSSTYRGAGCGPDIARGILRGKDRSSFQTKSMEIKEEGLRTDCNGQNEGTPITNMIRVRYRYLNMKGLWGLANQDDVGASLSSVCLR